MEARLKPEEIHDVDPPRFPKIVKTISRMRTPDAPHKPKLHAFATTLQQFYVYILTETVENNEDLAREIFKYLFTLDLDQLRNSWVDFETELLEKKWKLRLINICSLFLVEKLPS